MKSSRFLLSLVILLLAVALPSRAADAPVITAVSPRQVPTGSPGFTLVVQGRSFDKSSVVLCNGSERNTTWVSDHVLRAAILTSDIAKRRTLHIAVQVNGDDDGARSNSVRVMVNAAAGPQPVKITTTSLATARVGAAYSAALTAMGGKQPYRWTLAAGALPGGLSLASNGLISGTITASGNFPVTVSVQDSSTPVASTDIAAFSLSVAATVPAPSPVKITTLGLPGGQVGTLYQTQLTRAGGEQPYHWTLAAGALPGGLSLASNGLISGTPTASANFPVTVNVQDSSSPTAWTDMAVLSISIAAAPLAPSPVKITTLGLPGGQVGTLYQTQLTATGGKQPYTWTLASGPLPSGVSLAANGLISGTPMLAGVFLLTINAQGSTSPAASFDSTTLSINIAAAPPPPPPPPSPNSGGPVIFFSDLESGPNIGGQNDHGTILTLYGKRFGPTQGGSTITVGGGQVALYLLWSDSKVAVAIGANAATGSVVVHTSVGDSNGVPFTVRPGNIYFASPAGSDTNPGTFAAPFRTPVKGKNALAPGDILYLMDGISTSVIDNFGAVLNLRSSGAPGLPKAIVAYPGASVTLGADATPQRAILAPDVVGKPWTDWVIAGLTLRANDAALEMVGAQRWRVVGNDISCPNGHGASACAHGDTALFVKFLGNNVHDAGANLVGGIAEQKLYHSVYFSTDSNHVEVGWNTIVPNGGGCHALQFHSSPNGAGTGFNQFDLSVHDNLIHDARCHGINFATVDPSQGKVEAYNNVIYRAGLGPEPGASANYSCIAVLGNTNAGSPPGLSAAVQISNNTLYDCGARRNPDSGGMTTGTNGAIAVAMNNNIFFLLPGEAYFTGSSKTANVTGSNNLFFGAGAGPTFLTGNVNADPLFLDPLNSTSGSLRPARQSPRGSEPAYSSTLMAYPVHSSVIRS